jgi:hypothetical protein
MYVGGLQSTGGELVAMIDSKWHVHDNAIWRFLDMQGGNPVPKRNMVWNFRTGQEVLSLAHTWDRRLDQLQLHSGRDKGDRRKLRVGSVLALSPTGKYLAEAGSGVLSLYSLQP